MRDSDRWAWCTDQRSSTEVPVNTPSPTGATLDEAAAFLTKYPQVQAIDVFRRIERHGGAGERTISSAQVARTFKRIARLPGWDASQTARVSGHSTRIGATQDLMTAGATLPEIMLAGGWRSPTMPTHYSRKLSVGSGAMKRWLLTSRRER